jgi:hypothetical protein
MNNVSDGDFSSNNPSYLTSKFGKNKDHTSSKKGLLRVGESNEDHSN